MPVIPAPTMRTSTSGGATGRHCTDRSNVGRMTTLADVDAGVRAAIAAYTRALDDGRTDEVVATFCADGTVDIPGLGAHEGHDALRSAFSKVEPKWNQASRPQHVDRRVERPR